jgi:hypothetical protein
MSLNAATRSILLNGTDVTGNFDYTTGNGGGLECSSISAIPGTSRWRPRRCLLPWRDQARLRLGFFL